MEDGSIPYLTPTAYLLYNLLRIRHKPKTLIYVVDRGLHTVVRRSGSGAIAQEETVVAEEVGVL